MADDVNVRKGLDRIGTLFLASLLAVSAYRPESARKQLQRIYALAAMKCV